MHFLVPLMFNFYDNYFPWVADPSMLIDSIDKSE